MLLPTILKNEAISLKKLGPTLTSLKVMAFICSQSRVINCFLIHHKQSTKWSWRWLNTCLCSFRFPENWTPWPQWTSGLFHGDYIRLYSFLLGGSKSLAAVKIISLTPTSLKHVVNSFLRDYYSVETTLPPKKTADDVFCGLSRIKGPLFLLGTGCAINFFQM